MKITKYIHSCLLVEDSGKIVLIDPGIYTYAEKVLDINQLSQLDYILVTHEHVDHLSVPFLKEILIKFPKVEIISNQSVVQLLAKEGIGVSVEGNAFVEMEKVAHEQLWDKQAPENVLFRVFGKLSDPGDCHHFTSTTEVLALPIQAPWGSTVRAIELALELMPKVIIPIHDYHWKDDFRQGMYRRLEEFFGGKGIVFKTAESGITMEF